MMTKMAMMKLATSTLVLSTMMVGCSLAGRSHHPAMLSDARAARVASVAAAKARLAMAKHDADLAIGAAETAVAAQPRNADYRMLLGQAYLGAGRFSSAETSFADTLTLDPNRERAALNLALAPDRAGQDRRRQGDACRISRKADRCRLWPRNRADRRPCRSGTDP